ncbi:hypothetical protein [Bradyrhizobium sp. DASA03007]|uniref:hypothetical protein n=1 Tax=unclassified Bradyrhizobium TaxID=2631580 RepID=UPI003F724B21
MMAFAAFGGENGRPLHINPALVTHVIELNDRLCTVFLGGQHAVNIPLPVHVVVADLEKAAEVSR